MQAERLDHQVVCSKIEAADASVNLLAGSQHQNRKVEIERPDLLKNLLTVFDRHVQIEDREVRQILPKGLDGGSAVIGKANAMPVGLQPATKKQSQRFVVLSDQQPHGSSLPGNRLNQRLLPLEPFTPS
jgi:hypothetical protein